MVEEFVCLGLQLQLATQVRMQNLVILNTAIQLAKRANAESKCRRDRVPVGVVAPNKRRTL